MASKTLGTDRCHFDAVSTPFQRYFNAISTLFQRHFNAISTLFQRHSNTILTLGTQITCEEFLSSFRRSFLEPGEGRKSVPVKKWANPAKPYKVDDLTDPESW